MRAPGSRNVGLSPVFHPSREAQTTTSKSDFELIWSDRVNAARSVGLFFVVVVVFAFPRGQSEQQPGHVLATIDQSDIRGSEPHNHDPSGAASDC